MLAIIKISARKFFGEISVILRKKKKIESCLNLNSSLF